jgi:hypothetical protein
MPGLLQAPPSIDSRIPQRKRTAIDPTWASRGFEGGIDTILGALGIGPDTKMNQIGQLLMAALPIKDPRRLLGTSIPNKGKPILDEAGRFLGMESTPDTVYSAHVGSSRGKFELPKKDAGRYSNLSPSEATLERMMSRYKK